MGAGGAGANEGGLGVHSERIRWPGDIETPSASSGSLVSSPRRRGSLIEAQLQAEHVHDSSGEFGPQTIGNTSHTAGAAVAMLTETARVAVGTQDRSDLAPMICTQLEGNPSATLPEGQALSMSL